MIYVITHRFFKVEGNPHGHILRIVPIDHEDLYEILSNWPSAVSEEAARVIKERWGWDITPNLSGFPKVKPGNTIVLVWPEAILEVSVIT